MKIRIPGAPRTVAGRPVIVGPGRARKVALIGGSPDSLACAPWLDPSWEFWAHASVSMSIPHQRADRLFDPHPRNVFSIERKNGFKDYYGWLQHQPTPIYMQERYPDIPASVRYPLELVKQQWPGVPLGSTTAYMVALALLEGVTHLGFFGINYAHKTEYEEQRANAELWVGIAMGSGAQVVIPECSPLAHEPKLLYGYESHTPELFAERLERFRKMKESVAPKGKAFDSSRLVQMDEAAADRLIREKDPVWAAEVAKFVDEPMPEWMKEKNHA